MLEAKGVTGFTNHQLSSKIQRLGGYFGEKGNEFRGVKPHFAIISPKEPKRIDIKGWPAWLIDDGKLPWIELSIPDNLRKVTRCDEHGKVSNSGNCWKVVRG